MRYFLDTEFIESGSNLPIELISIGIVAEDKREYYAQVLHDRGFGKPIYRPANDFVARNVYPSLTHFDMGHQIRACDPVGFFSCSKVETPGDRCPWRPRATIPREIKEFCDPETYGKPEFWAWYGDYDWVVFCQLFGAMIDLPKGWPMYCKDIKQMCDEMGNPDLTVLGDCDEHNALGDARFNVKRFNTLQAIAASKS